MEYRIDTHEDLDMINQSLDWLISKNGISYDDIHGITNGDEKKADLISYWLVDQGCMKKAFADRSLFIVQPNAEKLRDTDYFSKVFMQCQKEQKEEKDKANKYRLEMLNLRVQLVVPWLALVISILSLCVSLIK